MTTALLLRFAAAVACRGPCLMASAVRSRQHLPESVSAAHRFANVLVLFCCTAQAAMLGPDTHAVEVQHRLNPAR